MSCGLYADEYKLCGPTSNMKKCINKLFGLDKKMEICDVKQIKKIILNCPCVILIDMFGNKTMVRIQENEIFDMEFGYYLVLAKYLSSNATYSELLAHIYADENKYREQRSNVLTTFLMGKLGVKRCREIDFRKSVDLLKLVHEKPKNYTINFQEVLNA